MPDEKTLKRAQRDLMEGKSPSTAAGEFVREEIDHVREGKHGARSPQQAIAIGLSKARRAGVPLPPPKAGKTKQTTRRSAERDDKAGKSDAHHAPSTRRSRAREQVLEREPTSTASHKALSQQSRRAARERSESDRHRAAEKAVKTKERLGQSSRSSAKDGSTRRTARAA